jgi:hypothetical protein
LKFKDIQITPIQQGMLASDAAWFTPTNIHEYQGGPPEVDEQIIPKELVSTNGRDHPPLSSPEASQDSKQDDSRFLTQAPPMMDESQAKQNTQLDISRTKDVATPELSPKGSQPEVVYDWPETPPKNAKKVTRLDVNAKDRKHRLQGIVMTKKFARNRSIRVLLYVTIHQEVLRVSLGRHHLFQLKFCFQRMC